MQYVRDSNRQAKESLPLASVCATDYLRGAVEYETDADGWAHPHRFGALQRRALASCLAWHPGIYRQAAVATAGVCLRFATDANEVALAVWMDEPLAAAKAALKAAEAVDGISVTVDGRSLGALVPTQDVVRFSLVNPDKDPGNGIVALPGLGERHEVCVWLPCLRPCRIRELWADGTYVETLPQRDRLLVVGDELAQGLACSDPAGTWPAIVAESLGLELVNQSVVGQVFQPSSILDVKVERVTQVVVALGGNYAHERCDQATVSADIRGLFAEVARHWPDAQVWALVPNVAASAETMRADSCADVVPHLIHRAARWRGATVLEERSLTDLSPGFLRGGWRFHDAMGHQGLASRLITAMGAADKA